MPYENLPDVNVAEAIGFWVIFVSNKSISHRYLEKSGDDMDLQDFAISL